jgi:hypothetical protein
LSLAVTFSEQGVCAQSGNSILSGYQFWISGQISLLDNLSIRLEAGQKFVYEVWWREDAGQFVNTHYTIEFHQLSNLLDMPMATTWSLVGAHRSIIFGPKFTKLIDCGFVFSAANFHTFCVNTLTVGGTDADGRA